MKNHRITLTLTLFSLSGCGGGSVQEVHSAAPPAIANDTGRITMPADSPKLQQIRVEDVELRVVAIDEVVAPGKIDVNPNRVSRVTVPVTGKVVTNLVRIGDSVRQGQLLLLLDSADADAAISSSLQADASLAQARSALIKAGADNERAKDLFAGEAGAKKDVLASDAALAQAKSALEQANALKDQAAAKLELLGLRDRAFHQKIEVRAPISGKILEMSVVPGEYRNDVNSPVMTIADLSSVWVVSEVPENAIRMIEKGERLEVELSAYPGRTFAAKVTRIADVVDPATRTVKVFAELSNPGGQLRPEMFGRIRHVDSARRMPVVPAGAVIEAEKQAVVYREIVRGTYEAVPVTLGNRTGTYIGVLSGIQARDRIVADGAMLLRAN